MLRIGLLLVAGGLVLAPLLAVVGHTVGHIVPLLGVLLQRLAPLSGLMTTFGVFMLIYSRFLPRRISPPPSMPGKPANPTQRQGLPEEPVRQPVGSVTEATTRFFDDPVTRTTAQHT